MQQFWCVRQNPRANTNQDQMRNFILSSKIVTCPFGHVGEERDNVIHGQYNCNQMWSSKSQDKRFFETMKIGDIILIPFKGQKECVLAKIISNAECFMHTGFYTTMMQNHKIQIEMVGEMPFRPVGRTIQILRTDVTFRDKRKSLSMKSLSRLSADTVDTVKDMIV